MGEIIIRNNSKEGVTERSVVNKKSLTNGEVIKALFPKVEICEDESPDLVLAYFNLRKRTNPRTVSFIDRNWWDAPYKEKKI